MTATFSPRETDPTVAAAVAAAVAPLARSDDPRLAFAPVRRVPALVPPTPVITTFQAGHAFVNNASGAANLNDTADFMLGSQSASHTTDGAGTAKTLKKSAMAALNATGKAPVVWLKVNDHTHIAGLQLDLGDDTLANRFRFELKMNGQGQPWALAGEWVAYRFSWGLAAITGAPNRASFTAAQLRLVDDATGNPVTVHYNGIALAPEPAAWPNGVCSFTFDDGFVSQFTDGKRILDQFAFPATTYLIADRIGAGSGYMTLAQAQQLQAFSGWEVAAHAYSDANVHAPTYTGVTAAALEDDIRRLRRWLYDNGFQGYDHCALPLGQFGSTTDGQSVLGLLRRYYTSVRTIYQGAREVFPPADPLRLRVQYVTNATPIATLQAAVDQAFANKEWIILVFHKLVATPALSTEWAIGDFSTLVGYVNTKGIPVRTVGDVLKAAA